MSSGISSNSIAVLQAVPVSVEASSQLPGLPASTPISLMPHCTAASAPENAVSTLPLCTSVNSYSALPVSTAVALSTMPTLTSHTNIIAYPPLSGHATLTNPSIAYQAFVPHHNFVPHSNINPYPGIGSQPTLTPQTRVPILAPHATLMHLPTVTPVTSLATATAAVELPHQQQQVPFVPVAHQEISNTNSQNKVQTSTGCQENETSIASVQTDAGQTFCGVPVTGTFSLVNTTLSSSPKSIEAKDSTNSSCECFVCNIDSCSTAVPLSTVMPYSHAPLLVLLADVLGYSLALQQSLHSQVVCQDCFHLLEVIDEATLTQSKHKADVRRRFQTNIKNRGLTYTRTDKEAGVSLCRRCGSRGPRRRPVVRGRRRPGAAGRDNQHLPAAAAAAAADRAIDKAVTKVTTDTHSNSGAKQKCRGAANATPAVPISSTATSTTSTDGSAMAGTDAAVTTNSSNPTYSLPKNTPSQTSSSEPSAPLARVYDDDPAIFAGTERLKVGVLRVDSSKYQCQYCAHACTSTVTLKMHVRVYHMPVLVYDEGAGEPMEETAEEDGSRLRMGLRLQNVATDPVSCNEKPFVCLFCESAYKLQSSLQSHFRDQHSPHRPFTCDRCQQSFRRNIELTRHGLYRCPARQEKRSAARKLQ